jgi:hypothetical protein
MEATYASATDRRTWWSRRRRHYNAARCGRCHLGGIPDSGLGAGRRAPSLRRDHWPVHSILVESSFFSGRELQIYFIFWDPLAKSHSAQGSQSSFPLGVSVRPFVLTSVDIPSDARAIDRCDVWAVALYGQFGLQHAFDPAAKPVYLAERRSPLTTWFRRVEPLARAQPLQSNFADGPRTIIRHQTIPDPEGGAQLSSRRAKRAYASGRSLNSMHGEWPRHRPRCRQRWPNRRPSRVAKRCVQLL